MAKGRRADLDHVQEEFLEWLLMDKRTRLVHGLPQTQQEFADAKGCSPRTLRRWKNGEAFQERLEQRRVELAKKGPGGAVSPRSYPQTDPRAKKRFEPPEAATPEDDPVLLGEVDDDEVRYRRMKDTLWRKAENGDRTSLELVMKHWGGEFAARDHERRESLFTDLSDDELVDEVLTLVGRGRVESWLADVS